MPQEMSDLNNLKIISGINNIVSKPEFEQKLKELISLMVQVIQEVRQTKTEVNQLYNQKLREFAGQYNMTIEQLKLEIGRLAETKVKDVLKKHETIIDQATKRLSEIRNGEKGEKGDAPTEEELKTIIRPMIDWLTNPKVIANKLEDLLGEDRLSIDAIHGLREKLEDLNNKKAAMLGGSGFNAGALDIHFTDDETPTGTVNGVNTDFVLNLQPSPTSSLKVYVNGQRMRETEDYTISATTITFLTPPPTGSIILCDYRH